MPSLRLAANCALIILCQLQALAQGAADGDSRRFDQVSFLYTHNSYNCRKGHSLPNQNLTVAQQLELGVRGFMLDVYWRRDRAVLFHGSPILGKHPLNDDLTAIHDFLAAHPREVLSIIFESYVTDDQLRGALDQAGLLPYLHAQPKDAAWPTLADMAAAGHQLVVFSEANRGSAYPWLHHVWDYATENRWSNHSRADFEWHYNRGDSTRQLFLLNHFITHRKLGYGLPDSARLANTQGNILHHAMTAWSLTGHFPNFIAVDFVDLGNAAAAVRELNSQWQPTAPLRSPLTLTLTDMPQERRIFLSLPAASTDTLRVGIRDHLSGAALQESKHSTAGVTGLYVHYPSRLHGGIYQIEIRRGDQLQILLMKLGQLPPSY